MTKTAKPSKSPAPKSAKARSARKPNILVIWGDDIGISNLSCYTRGLMGYQTPNIDRIANEGMMFTDSYGEQSCTAGRSSFITGQSVLRTGLSKVGFPGAPVGMTEKALTIAGALKNQGYATGQFGKNHLGDLNHMLPTNHGFDEFFGNLYHLNAEEEPEMYDWPPEDQFPEFNAKLGPRGVIHSWATDKDEIAFTLEEMNCFSSDIRLRETEAGDPAGRASGTLVASGSTGTNGIPCNARDPEAQPKKKRARG